jgi:hypothetical protein
MLFILRLEDRVKYIETIMMLITPSNYAQYTIYGQKKILHLLDLP